MISMVVWRPLWVFPIFGKWIGLYHKANEVNCGVQSTMQYSLVIFLSVHASRLLPFFWTYALSMMVSEAPALLTMVSCLRLKPNCVVPNNWRHTIQPLPPVAEPSRRSHTCARTVQYVCLIPGEKCILSTPTLCGLSLGTYFNQHIFFNRFSASLLPAPCPKTQSQAPSCSLCI